MFAVNTGVIASRNKGLDLQGKSFDFPVFVSSSPNTFRGYEVAQVPLGLSAVPNAFIAQQVNLFPVQLSKGPLLFVAPDVDPLNLTISSGFSSSFTGQTVQSFPVNLARTS